MILKFDFKFQTFGTGARRLSISGKEFQSIAKLRSRHRVRTQRKKPSFEKRELCLYYMCLHIPPLPVTYSNLFSNKKRKKKIFQQLFFFFDFSDQPPPGHVKQEIKNPCPKVTKSTFYNISSSLLMLSASKYFLVRQKYICFEKQKFFFIGNQK